MIMKLLGNYVIDATPEVTPSIRISPFTERFLYTNLENEGKDAECYLRNRFGNYILMPKARNAIAVVLSFYQLKKEDVVTILTTSGNFYISSCVTHEIEKICTWSRVLSNKTKIIFINHEFGYPFQGVEMLLHYGIPIIEDCAHTFFYGDNGRDIGKYSDFVLYSLPKFFPMQLGGLLVDCRNIGRKLEIDSLGYEKYILSNLSTSVSQITDYAAIRSENQKYLLCSLSRIGIRPFFDKRRGDTPGVFLFKWLKKTNYPLLKQFMQRNGVESSVFYGQNAFFIPVHQELDRYCMDYMVSLLKYFYSTNI